MKQALVLGLAAAVLGLTACDDDDDPIEPESQILELSFTGLEPLANGYHYEGWAIINGAPVTTGKFNIDTNGALVTTSGGLIVGGAFDTGIDLEATTMVIITIEPAGDTDVVPAATHVMAGPISGVFGNLTVGDGAALGDDFLGATGDFILATPTDGAGNNENSGIWFLSLASGSPAVGLALPTLPAGWAYEGWAVTGGEPVTTGRFTSVDVADLAAPFSGPTAGPPFPGEDFLMNAPAGLVFPTDLAGGLAVISIEPEPDDSPAPFTLKPLMGGIDAAAVDHVTYSMPNMTDATFPTGTAQIR